MGDTGDLHTDRDAESRHARIKARLVVEPTGVPLARQPASAAALRAFAAACLAVHRAHLGGVIHRDLHPANVVIDELGDAHVIGWSHAKLVEEPDAEIRVGTHGYGAPEQAGGVADARADVYGLGCLLFELLAGQPLHPSADDLETTLRDIDRRPSVRAPERDIAPELDALCAAATTPDRKDRIATAREIAERVLAYLDGDRGGAKRIAREYLGRAKSLFDIDRPRAVREANCAAILDPTLTDATGLLARHLLEPPRAMPSDVVALIATEDTEMIRQHSRSGIRGFMGYLMTGPAFLWLSAGESRYALALLGLLAITIALLVRQGYLGKRPLPHFVALCGLALVALLARAWSPFLFAPGIAAVTIIGLAFSPVYASLRRFIPLVVCTLVAVLAPWVAEYAGWVSETTIAVHDGLLINAPGLHLREGGQLWLVVVFVPTLVIAAAVLGRSMVQNERAMRHRLHLQAHQLRQLLPIA